MTTLVLPRGDKVERVAAISGEIEGAAFLLPLGAPWLAAFRSELRAFPDGRHDDQVDALSQFVRWQMLNWRYLLEEYLPDGRVRRIVREEVRPWGPCVDKSVRGEVDAI